MSTKTRDFWKLFKPSACSLRLKGTTPATIFEELVGNLVSAKALSPDLADAAREALEEREQLASTGVGMNVAIPHVKLRGLEEVVVSLSVHPEGLEWRSLDGDPAELFFLVLRPEGKSERHDPERHLEMMRWISVLSRDGDFRNFARRATKKTELVDLLKEMSNLGT